MNVGLYGPTFFYYYGFMNDVPEYVDPMERFSVAKGCWMMHYGDGGTFGPLTTEDAMSALEVILKSRRDSVVKIDKQIADLESVVKDCSLTVRPVYETELRVKRQRRERLVREVGALEAEVARLAPPELPGMPPRVKPSK